MRVAIFVAIVAAHLILFLLFPSLWRRVASGGAEEPALTPIFLPSRVALQGRAASQTRPPQPEREAAGRRTSKMQASEERPSGEPASDSREPQSGSITPAPDWRAQAEDLAHTSAQHIVEAEDTAKRQADALATRFKPLAPDRVRGRQFGWNYAATHRISPLPGGGLVYSFNDHCQLAISPLPFVGCTVGKIEANGDLFEYLHPPLKFGDWDKRDHDP